MFHFINFYIMKLKQLLVTTAALFICFQIAAQDLIYRNNGKIIKAKILNTVNKSLSYKLYDQMDSTTHFISVAIIDSIIYQNGKKETFIKTIVPSIQQSSELITNYNHHLIGADLYGYLLYRNLIISYEYLPGKAKVGFKAAFAKNLEPWSYYNDAYFFDGDNFNFIRIPEWSARVGLNYYFFPPQTFRIGTGAYYIFGSYTTEDYIYSTDYSTSTLVTENKNFQGIVLSLLGFYNIHKNLAINLGFDAPLYLSPSSKNTIIRGEILINF